MKIAGKSIWKYTIVCYDNFLSRRCAERIRDAIVKRVGVRLQIVTDDAEPRECEILVGKTCRPESREIRSRYDRPNLCYDIKTKNGKLVCMGEGHRTLDKIGSILEALIASDNGSCIDGEIASGDLREDVYDNMIDRAEGTDLRVFDWNTDAPYLRSAARFYNSDVERGEVVADVILTYMPDVILTNELYEGSRLYNAAIGELSEYYEVIDKSLYEVGKPYDFSDALPRRPKPENIIYKKGIGLKLIVSGWRYLSELMHNNTHVYCHGIHSAVFERESGDKFLVSVGHYADSRANKKWALEHHAAISDMLETVGEDTLPTVITGDMFTFVNFGEAEDLSAGYRAHRDAGFVDSQIFADVNANDDTGHGTFHSIGVRHTRRVSEDFIWCRDGIRALKFKVLALTETDRASDHYPVMADLKLN